MSQLHFAELVTTPQDGVELTWEVGYYWSKPIPATYLDPPEGGLELEPGHLRIVEVTYYPAEGEDFTIRGIQEGSILDILLSERYGTPSDEACEEAAAEDNAARMEDPRW